MLVKGEMESNVTEPESFWDILQDMDPTWITTVLLVPCVIVLTAGFFYLYGAVIGLLSKTSVRNKVVVISDALSGLGRECAGVFHKGGARLILCGKSWEKLEEFADDLANASDPTVGLHPSEEHLKANYVTTLPEGSFRCSFFSLFLEDAPLRSFVASHIPRFFARPRTVTFVDLGGRNCDTFPPKLVLLDFGDMDSMPDVITEILECYGCLDVLILNSSMKVKAPAQSVSLEMDKLLMDNNYFGPATLAKGVLPSMISRRTGHLLLISSIQGKLAVPFRTTYAASKHAVQAFFDCLRAEVEEYGISVSTINHTFISPSSAGVTEAASSRSIWSLFYTKKPLGVSPDEAAAEIVKTLHNKKKEVVMAPSLPKVAIYARSFFPNVFFAVMAAGVNNAGACENM